MAADLIAISTPQRKVNERSSMVFTARFRNRATNLDVTPTNVRYRLDDEQVGPILDWTAVTAATSVTITLTSAQNAILNDTRSLEAKVLSVASDYGLATQYIESSRYEVRNQGYFS